MARYPRGSLIPDVLRTLRTERLIGAGDLALVAVSGGIDSVCLLHCLQVAREPLSCALHVAHVHHGLRGVGADQDAAFVARLAAANGVPSSVLRVDVSALRRAGHLSSQDAARRARHSALRALAAEIGAACIATGHTEDDQAETVLLHLLRGSGIDGLAGMRYRQGAIVRPLLGLSRAAIEEHSRVHALEWREDASNAGRSYLRNRLRLDLLPALEAYNPRVRRSLARGAAGLARDATYLHERAAEALAAVTIEEGVAGVWLDRSRYAALPAALRAHALRLQIARLLGGTQDVSWAHLDALERLALGGKAGRLGQLPRRLRAEASGSRLRLWVAPPRGEAEDVPSHDAAALVVPGRVRFGEWSIEAAFAPASGRQSSDQDADGIRHEAWCDSRIGLSLTVRSRRAGDRLRPIGLGGSKSLQDLLVDRKVPRAARTRWPLVIDSEGIVWAVGLALDERARLGDDAVDAIRLRAWRE